MKNVAAILGICLCFGFAHSSSASVAVCAGSDSLSVTNPWTQYLPPGYEIESVGVGGDTSETWRADNPNTRLYRIVDCEVAFREQGATEIIATMNLGTNDHTRGIPEDRFLANGLSATSILSLFFDRVVWIYPHYDLRPVCDTYENALCIEQDSVLDDFELDYVEGLEFGCCHLTEHGGAKLAAAVVQLVPEPSAALCSLAALLVLAALHRYRSTSGIP